MLWCAKGDLNPYGVTHMPLKHARLPVPPLARRMEYYKGVLSSMQCFLRTRI